ncbi:MAG: nickel pincer cofactor biosynthesis protein LarC [Planctomycetota bacterium]
MSRGSDPLLGWRWRQPACVGVAGQSASVGVADMPTRVFSSKPLGEPLRGNTELERRSLARQLHFDCFSGISGDMALGALLDLGVPEEVIQETLGSLGLEGKLVVEKTRKAGFAVTRITVDTPHQHAHRHLSHILKILDQGKMTDGARTLAKRMFEKLGEAEAASHGIPVQKVHFHEVGAVDSIFDFVGVAVAIDWLKPEKVTSRPVPTGSGWVKCDHGNLPVPAPAVARLLSGIPLASSPIQSELTTPTGAAIIATLVQEFVEFPACTIEKVGVGAGTKDFEEQPNILRIVLGETQASANTDRVWQLETNLDDTTPETIGYCFDRLFEEGALDVFSSAIQMKKNRPGTLLTVLCRDADVSAMERILFQETGTFGIRKFAVERAKLEREARSASSPWGPIRGKLGWNNEVRVFTPEYEDCARVAREHGVPLQKVYREVIRGFADDGA